MKNRKFNLTGHKALWHWLADNPGKFKKNYFDSIQLPEETRPKKLCYACDYDKNKCVHCPLCGWNINGLDVCWSGSGSGGLYKLWIDAMCAHNYDRACKIARRIADLPVIKGVECI